MKQHVAICSAAIARLVLAVLLGLGSCKNSDSSPEDGPLASAGSASPDSDPHQRPASRQATGNPWSNSPRARARLLAIERQSRSGGPWWVGKFNGTQGTLWVCSDEGFLYVQSDSFGLRSEAMGRVTIDGDFLCLRTEDPTDPGNALDPPLRFVPIRFGHRVILLYENALSVFYYKEYRSRPDYLPDRATADYFYKDLDPGFAIGEESDSSPRTLAARGERVG